MVLSDRIRRQLFDGLTFQPTDAPESAPDHLFVDSDLQIRMGVGAYIGYVPNVKDPQMADVPVYNADLKIWEPAPAAQANVAIGTFESSDWLVSNDGKSAYILIMHGLNTQSLNCSVFDTTSGVPTQTYVEEQAWSTSSMKLTVAAAAVFNGSYVFTVVSQSGVSFARSTASGGVGLGGSINLGDLTGETTITWGLNRCIKATLTGNTELWLETLGISTDRVVLIIGQDSEGDRSLLWAGSNVKFSNGFQPESSLTPGAEDLYEFIWDGSSFICSNFVPNIS